MKGGSVPTLDSDFNDYIEGRKYLSQREILEIWNQKYVDVAGTLERSEKLNQEGKQIHQQLFDIEKKFKRFIELYNIIFYDSVGDTRP